MSIEMHSSSTSLTSSAQESLVGTQLQSLQDVTVLPERYTSCMEFLARLQTIGSIQINEIVKHDDGRERGFIIEIYAKQAPKSHIPTNNASADCDHASAYELMGKVERTLSELIDFRVRLCRLVLVQDRHLSDGRSPDCKRCWYCTKVANYFLSTAAQPTPLMNWLVSRSKLKRSLTQFLENMQALTLLCKPSVYPNCSSQRQMPIIVSDFLFDGGAPVMESSDSL